MGVVFSSMFALGLLLYVWARSEVHLEHILFGDVLGTSPQDLLESGSIALVVAGWISLKWRDLMLQSFDPVQARTAGLPVRLLHYALLAAVSLAVVGALKSVGIVLTISLLIAPGAIARLLTRTFGRMLVVAVLLTVVTSLVGVYLAFFLDSAPAPTIVLRADAQRHDELHGQHHRAAAGHAVHRGAGHQHATGASGAGVAQPSRQASSPGATLGMRSASAC